MKGYKIFITFFLLMFGFLKLHAQPLSAILPKNNANIPTFSVAFQWNSLTGATGYKVMVASDTSFTLNYAESPILGVTNWSSFVSQPGKFYWKVQGTTALGTTYSPIYAFTYFVPNHLNTNTLWLKADGGISLDASNKVQNWTDLSGNGNVFAQPTAAKRPIITANSVNGYPSVNFQGNQFLNGGDVLDLGFNSRSMFLIGKMGASNQTFFAKSKAGAFTYRYALLKDVANTAFLFHADIQSSVYSTFNTTNFGFYNAFTNRAVGNNYSSVNNNLLGTSSFNPAIPIDSPYRFLIGAYNNATDNGELLPLVGNICEIVFIDSHDSTEINKVRSYLQHKYSPPLNLGADIKVTNGFCAQNLTATAGFSNYLWNSGATTQTISANQTGYYWVSAKDPFGFTWSDTIYLSYPDVTPPVSTILCANATVQWNTGLGAGFTHVWSTGATQNSISISQPGNYSVSVVGAGGCPYNSGNIYFNLDNYPNTTYLGQDTAVCVGNTIGLQIGAGQTTQYLWQDGSTNPQYAATNQGTYTISLTSTNVNGCVAQDTMQITVAGFAPQLNYSISASGCTNAPIWFANNSTVPPPSLLEGIQWSFDNGQTFSSNNGQFQPNAVGWIYGEIEAIATGNCISRDTFSTFIFAPPNVQISNTGFCENENIAFEATDSNGVALTDFSWNFGQPSAPNNLDTLENPIHLYQSPGNYNITLTATDANGCLDTANHSLSLLTAPTSQFSVTQFCEQTNIPYNNTSFSNDTSLIVQFHWEFGDGNTDSLINPTHLYAQEGVYSNQLIAVSSNGCSDTISQTIQIQPSPVLSWNLSPSCKDLPTVFESTSTIPSGSIDSTQWLINLQFPFEETQGAYTFLTNGIQYLNLTAISDLGCSADTLILVNVNPGLSTAFTVNPQVCLAGSEATFTPTGFGYNSLQWQIGSEAIDTLNAFLYLVPDSLQNDTLEVLCIGSNAVGCVDTTIVTVPILGRALELGISQLYLSEINGQSFVGVTLENQGTILIDSCTLRLSLSNNVLFENLCTQVILPGQNYIYVFPSSPMLGSLGQNEISDLLCVNAVVETFENIKEESLLNNQGCLLLEGQLFDLTNPSPNPAAESTMVQLIVSEPMTITMDSYNLQGQKIATILDHVMLEEGTYSIEIDLAKYAKGNYYLEVGKGTTSIKKSLLRW